MVRSSFILVIYIEAAIQPLNSVSGTVKTDGVIARLDEAFTEQIQGRKRYRYAKRN